MDNNFNSTEILSEIKEIESTSQSDKALFEKIEQEDKEHRKEYDRRDNLYSDLLEEYINAYKKKTKRNRKLKLAFFFIVVFTFCVIILGSVASLIIVSIVGQSIAATVSVITGSVISIISAIIVLPKIIAEYLFPTDEEQNMNEMIKNMQENDSRIRQSFQTNKNGHQQ